MNWNWKDYQSVEAPEAWIQAAQRLEAEPQRKRKHRRVLRPALCCAAVLLLCAGGAAAAGGYFDRVQNPTVVSSTEEMAADIAAKESQAAEAESNAEAAEPGTYDIPNSTEASTLEEATAYSRFKSDGWSSEDTMGGQASVRSIEWVSMEMLNDEGPVKSRIVYDDAGGSKTEYTAEDPALLDEVQDGPLHWSISALSELYTPISYGNFCYAEYDKDRSYQANCLEACYQMDDTHWVLVECAYHADWAYTDTGDYVIEDYYDEVESYTNSSGYEFIIKTYGNQLWADYQGTYSYASIYSNNPDIEAAKEILDNIVITETE